jgi:hypothetical protein
MRLTAVLNVLLRSHAQRFVTGGWRGVAAMGALVWLTLRIGVTGVAVGMLDIDVCVCVCVCECVRV